MHELNPFGNGWERLRSAYFLLRYPHEFVDGIIEEFISRVAALTEETLAKMKAEQPPDAPEPVAAQLAVAASIAAQESMNG